MWKVWRAERETESSVSCSRTRAWLLVLPGQVVMSIVHQIQSNLCSCLVRLYLKDVTDESSLRSPNQNSKQSWFWVRNLRMYDFLFLKFSFKFSDLKIRTYLYVSRFNSEDWNTIVSSEMEHSRKKILAISNEAKDCPICHLHFRNNKAFASDCLHCFCYQCISNWVQVSSIKCFIVHFSLHQFFELSSCFSASSHVSTMS